MAEQTVHTAEKAVVDAGDKISAETKQAVQDAIAKVNEVKNGDNKESIQTVTSALSGAMQKIGEEMAKANPDAAKATEPTADQPFGPNGPDMSGATK